jgi:hypothetical protein
MSKLEKTLAAAAMAVALFGSYFILPHRVESVEKVQSEMALRVEAEREKLNGIRESVSRIEERLSAVQRTVDSLDRRQRTGSSTSSNNNN